MRQYTSAEEARLMEATAALRSSPAFAIVEARLKELLEDLKTALVTNQTSQVPILQGRAQQLLAIIELLNRKPT
jgi:hypothetical protein